MKPVVTAGEKKRDRNTLESAGVPGMVLMERAALKNSGSYGKISG